MWAIFTIGIQVTQQVAGYGVHRIAKLEQKFAIAAVQQLAHQLVDCSQCSPLLGREVMYFPAPE